MKEVSSDVPKSKREVYGDYVRMIEKRYDRDLIINIAPVLAALVLPLLLAVFLFFITNSSIPAFSKFVFLGQDSPMSIWFVPVLVEPLILGMVIYRLYSRLRSHARRDAEERGILIDYAEASDADVSELRALDKKARKMSRFPGRYPALLALILMHVYVVACFLYFLPAAGSIEEMNGALAVILYAFVLVILLAVFVKVIRYPYQHEKNQMDFSRAFARAMDEDGDGFEKMTGVIKHHSLWVSVLLMVATLGLYTVVVLYQMFKNTNMHIKNQWAYEDRLLGDLAFDCLGKRTDTAPAFSTRWDEMSRTPLTMRFAELFMLAILAVYVLDMIGTAADIEMFPDSYNIAVIGETLAMMSPEEQAKQLMKYGMVAWNVVFMTFTLDAVMAIGSRRASAWRKVAVNCLTFIVPTWISYFLYSVDSYTHLFDLDPYLTTALLYVLLLFMFVSVSVREFYTPPTKEVPTAGQLLRFAVTGKVVSADVFADAEPYGAYSECGTAPDDVSAPDGPDGEEGGKDGL